MKRLLIFWFVTLLLSAGVQAQYLYTTNGSEITITGYSGPGGTVVIPNTINGYPVTSIGDYAFQNNGTLTNLIVGTNVLSIGRNTFAYNTNLTTVIIPDSVTNIVGGTFYTCTNLVSITLGVGILSVGDSAFAFDSSLVALYFQGNAPNFVSLTSVFFSVHAATIYYNVGTMGWAASYDALSTKTIQSQYGFKTVGAGVAITNYTGAGGAVAIPAAITDRPVTSIEEQAFVNHPAMTSVTIPDSVTNIGVEAFMFCTGLTRLTIPDSVISIGEFAFDGCTGLTSVGIPGNVRSIDGAPFADCTGLTVITVASQNLFYASVNGVLFNKNKTTLVEYPEGLTGAYVIPNGVSSITDYAFLDCSGLKGVTIPNGVINVGVDAFNACTGLTNITLPNTLQAIQAQGFAFCSGLATITIPASVTGIGFEAFAECSSLKKLFFQGNAPGLGASAFAGVDASAKVYYMAGTTGWTTTYGGLPTVELFLPALGKAGVAGDFGFAITGVTNVTIVVEASTNLVTWQPIQTNANPPFQFNDPTWGNYRERFYRVGYLP